MEVLALGTPSEASTVWSFAMASWQVFAEGVLPFAHAATEEEAVHHVSAGHQPPCPATCPQLVYAVLCECWRPGPSERPSLHMVAARLRLVVGPIAMEAARREALKGASEAAAASREEVAQGAAQELRAMRDQITAQAQSTVREVAP